MDFCAGGALVVLVGLGAVSGAGRRAGGGRSNPVPAGYAAVRLVNFKANDAALTDPTPLFLPTKWNAGQNALPANTQREPGGSFQGYPPKLAFAETELKLDFPAVVRRARATRQMRWRPIAPGRRFWAWAKPSQYHSTD